MSINCYFFGCWNEAGHFLRASKGSVFNHELEQKVVYFKSSGSLRHLDGGLAPRIATTDQNFERGTIIFAAAFPKNSRESYGYTSVEAPQGQFLLHHLDNGYTAIQWWDRNQGDTRGACNSTVLLEGVHSSEVMLKALAEHFPHVLANLVKANVALIEVKMS